VRDTWAVDLRKLAKFVLWTALIGGALWGVLRFLLVKTWTVPSDDPVLSSSIAPSLGAGDAVLLLHGLPRGFGDLVRCTDPDEPQRWVIGRIAGEGGDTVELTASRLVVNGRTADIEHACSPAVIKAPHPNTSAPVDLRCDMEDLGGVIHMRAHGNADGRAVNAPMKRTVPPDSFFLISDNRAFQNDSFTYGAVPAETCDARIIFRFWSSEGFGDAENRFTWVN
jgi:signal peptidase I